MVRIDGHWPSAVHLSRGWARASARPWNDDSADGFIRLIRGGRDFLADAAETVARLCEATVLSPAMYPSSTRIWVKAGFEPASELDIMERSMSVPVAAGRSEVTESPDPDWPRILEIDRGAFEGFWRMSLDGLKEAVASTKRSSVLEIREDRELIGYAIVGAQWDVSYLQRIAVSPDHYGRSLGSDLVRAALRWGKKAQSRLMVLNVREENARARSLYVKEGFNVASTRLRIMRYGP